LRSRTKSEKFWWWNLFACCSLLWVSDV